MGNIRDIKKTMLDFKEEESALSQLNNTSRTSVWRLLIYIVAYCISDQHKYFDEHRAYVNHKLANQIAGTLPWYRLKALEFQDGFDLIKDTDKFNNDNASIDQIEASKVIKYAAVNTSNKGAVIVKVATEVDGKLSTIEPYQEESLKEYFEEIKFAGVEIVVINHLADKLFLKIQIYRDPLVIDENGVSIRRVNNPVKDALQEFMKELPFNGELVIQSLVDKLQKVEGVRIVNIKEVKSSSIDPNSSTGTHGVATAFQVSRIPYSGYFEIDNFDDIEYVV